MYLSLVPDFIFLIFYWKIVHGFYVKNESDVLAHHFSVANVCPYPGIAYIFNVCESNKKFLNKKWLIFINIQFN